MDEYYHKARIKVLKEEKRKIDKEIQKHRDRLASRSDSKVLVQDKKA
jgi:hypothetical protein